MTARLIVWADSGQERCLSSSKPHLILTIALDSITLDLSRRVQIHLFTAHTAGVLYRYDPDGSLHRMIEGLIIPNGISHSYSN